MKNRFKKALIYGSTLFLALSIACGESGDNSWKSLINGVSYSSNSYENSENHWFVTGEDINVAVSLEETVDRAYVNIERRFRDNLVEEQYDMDKGAGNNYNVVIPAFDDGGILWFRVVVRQGDRTESASSITEPIYVSEDDFHTIVKGFCDERNQFWDNCRYNIDEILDVNGRTFYADVNLKKVEANPLVNNALVEYGGGDDISDYFLDEDLFLNDNNVNHKYIYPLMIPNLPWNASENEITNKQDILNYFSGFYYGLY